MTDTPETTEPTFLDYARRGRTHHWFRWVGTGLLAIVFGVILQFVVIGIAVAAGISLQRVMDMLEKPSDPIGFFLMAGALFGCFVIGLWIAARWIQGKRFSDLIGRWQWGAFGAGALIWLVFIAASSAIDWLIDPQGFTVSMSNATAYLAVAALVGLGVQAFSEEFLFRGWVTQGWLLATKNPVAAALLSGLLFGSVHLSNPDGLVSAASATTFGIATSLIAIRLGSLAFGYGMHLVNNVWGAVVVVSSNDVFKGAPAIFSQHTSGLDWSDVGIEAVCLAVVTALVYAKTRPRIPKAG